MVLLHKSNGVLRRVLVGTKTPSIAEPTKKKKFHHAMLLAFAFSALTLLVGRQGNGRASGL